MAVIKTTLAGLILAFIWINQIEGLDRSGLRLLNDVENFLEQVQRYRNWANYFWRRALREAKNWRPNKRKLISWLNGGIEKDEEAEGLMRDVCDSVMDNYDDEFDAMIDFLLRGARTRKRAQEHFLEVARRAGSSLRRRWSKSRLRSELKAARKDREHDDYYMWRAENAIKDIIRRQRRRF